MVPVSRETLHGMGVMCSYHPNPGSHHDYAIIIIVATMAVPHATAPATPARQHPPRAAGRRRRGVPRRHLLVVDAWCRPATRASTSSFAAPPRCRLVGARSSPAWRRRAKGARRSHPLSRTAACHGRPKTPRQRMQRRRLGVAPRWWWRCERSVGTFSSELQPWRRPRSRHDGQTGVDAGRFGILSTALPIRIYIFIRISPYRSPDRSRTRSGFSATTHFLAIS